MLTGGLDIGTSGCKIAVYDENGKLQHQFYAEYDIARNQGLHEVDLAAVWDAVCTVLSKAAQPELAAIAVTSFGETFVMLDAQDRPLAPAMLYTDPRGKEECESIINRFSWERLAGITGVKLHCMYSLPKILWIKHHWPEVFAKAKRICLMQDYIVYRLTGTQQIDYSLAARTGAFDLQQKTWFHPLWEACGISEALLSRPVPSGTVAGAIKRELAQQLHLSPRLAVVNGCHDQIAAMTGAGVLTGDQVMDATGTVECVPVVFNSLPESSEIFTYGYSFAPHINGTYACYALSYAGGATLKWFKQAFSDLSYAEMDAQVPDMPTGLLLLPYFAGAATPYMDSSAKAAILGLTFEHGQADIYKALMEGTAYEILLNLDVLHRFGIEPKSLLASGGGAKSDVWLQIKADILNLPVTALSDAEIGAAGTAYLAGKALGIYGDLSSFAQPRRTFFPNPQKHAHYHAMYQKYKRLYAAVKEVG